MKNRRIQARLQSWTGKLDEDELDDMDEDLDFSDSVVIGEIKKNKDDNYHRADKYRKRNKHHENVDDRPKGDV